MRLTVPEAADWFYPVTLFQLITNGKGQILFKNYLRKRDTSILICLINQTCIIGSSKRPAHQIHIPAPLSPDLIYF